MARAQCSGTVEEWLCRLGRARHRQGFVSAVAGANRGGGAGAVKLNKTRARVGRALRRLGRGRDEVNEKPPPSPHFISLKRQPNSHFRYYSEFEPQPASPES